MSNHKIHPPGDLMVEILSCEWKHYKKQLNLLLKNATLTEERACVLGPFLDLLLFPLYKKGIKKQNRLMDVTMVLFAWAVSAKNPHTYS